MSESDLKVTDRRMFTPDGELREEFRHLEGGARPRSAETPADESAGPAAEPRPAPSTAGAPQPEPGAARLEIPSDPGLAGSRATFYDLLASLVEPAALYLGDLQAPDGETHQDLDLARLHIDLVEILRDKTAGNLDSRELAVLEDSLYQLRMRYVQKRDA